MVYRSQYILSLEWEATYHTLRKQQVKFQFASWMYLERTENVTKKLIIDLNNKYLRNVEVATQLGSFLCGQLIEMSKETALVYFKILFHRFLG